MGADPFMDVHQERLALLLGNAAELDSFAVVVELIIDHHVHLDLAGDPFRLYIILREYLVLDVLQQLLCPLGSYSFIWSGNRIRREGLIPSRYSRALKGVVLRGAPYIDVVGAPATTFGVADGLVSRSTKIPAGTGSRLAAICDNPSTMVFFPWGMCSNLRPSKWCLSFRTSSTYVHICGQS
jgi:hypothetical protein